LDWHKKPARLSFQNILENPSRAWTHPDHQLQEKERILKNRGMKSNCILKAFLVSAEKTAEAVFVGFFCSPTLQSRCERSELENPY